MEQTIDRANDMTRLWWSCAQMSTDIPFIIAMRMWGLSGVWSVPDSEHHDMFQEKAPAFAEAIVAGALTAWAGRGPDRVMQAAIEPISRKTRANRMRLASCGPRLPGPPLVSQSMTGSL